MEDSRPFFHVNLHEKIKKINIKKKQKYKTLLSLLIRKGNEALKMEVRTMSLPLHISISMYFLNASSSF